MCVCLAYLFAIGCLQRVACVCKDHPGGFIYRCKYIYIAYIDVNIYIFPRSKKKIENSQRGAAGDVNPGGVTGAYETASRFKTSARRAGCSVTVKRREDEPGSCIGTS